MHKCTVPTCNEVLNSSNERLPITRGHQVGLHLQTIHVRTLPEPPTLIVHTTPNNILPYNPYKVYSPTQGALTLIRSTHPYKVLFTPTRSTHPYKVPFTPTRSPSPPQGPHHPTRSPPPHKAPLPPQGPLYPYKAPSTPTRSTHPHQDKCLCLGLLSLWQVEIHLISIKVSIVWCTHALVEAKCSMRKHSGLSMT